MSGEKHYDPMGLWGVWVEEDDGRCYWADTYIDIGTLQASRKRYAARKHVVSASIRFITIPPPDGWPG